MQCDQWCRSVSNIGGKKGVTIERPKAARGWGRGLALPQEICYFSHANGAFWCIFLGTQVDRFCNITTPLFPVRPCVSHVGLVDCTHCNIHLACEKYLFFCFKSTSSTSTPVTYSTSSLSHLPSSSFYPLPYPFLSPVFHFCIAVGEF